MRPSDDDEITEYLLGGLDSIRLERIEERSLADPAYFEQIEMIEEELIDSYIRGQMDRRRRQRFEKAYLSSTPRRSRVEQMMALHRASLAMAPTREHAKAVFLMWRRALPVLAGAGALAIAMLVVVLRPVHRPSNAQIPAAGEVPESIYTAELQPGRNRGQPQAGKPQSGAMLQFSRQVASVLLELKLPSGTAGGNLEAALSTAEGVVIGTSPAQSIGTDRVQAVFSAKLFSGDDYVLRLQRIRADAGDSVVASYYFRAGPVSGTRTQPVP